MRAIRGIEMQEYKNRIVIHYGTEAYEFITIKDDRKKNEVFTYMRDEIPNTRYELIPYNWKKDSKVF